MVLALAACGQSAAPAAAPAASPAAEPAATASAEPAAAEPAAETPAESGDKKPSVGFVTFGLGGDFFQALADNFVTTMQAEGWEASYVDGEFNPTTQIAAMENYIAQGVDEIIVWSVAPEAMTTVIDQARNALTERIATSGGGQAGAMAAALVTGKRGLISEATNNDLLTRHRVQPDPFPPGRH